MKGLVAYFSRTGNTRKIAEDVSRTAVLEHASKSWILSKTLVFEHTELFL